MSKINLTDATTLTNETSFVSSLNANYDTVVTAIDNTLSLDGTSPNSMGADFDMNSYRILNLPPPTAAEEPLRLQDLADFLGSGTVTTGAPTGASYVTLATSSSLSAERVLTAGSNISLTDGGAGSTLTAAVSTSPTFTGTINGTPSGTNRGFLITQAGANGSATNPTLNAINIADSIDAGTGTVDGMAIYHGFGSTSAKGSRQGLQVTLDLTSATNSSNASRYYVALDAIAKATTNDGGGLGTEKGAMSAINPVVWLTGSATNMAEGSVIEANTQWETSSTGLDKYGYKIVQTSLDKVAGSRNDAAFLAANQVGAVGWGTLIQIGDALNASPLKTTGSILAIKGTPTIANGIDLSGATISTAAFKSTSFLVSGTGVIIENANAAAVPTAIAGTMLQLNQVDSSAAGIMLNSFAAASQINLARAQNTGASPGATAISNSMGIINFRGYDTSAYATGGFLRGVAGETWTASAHGTLIDFITTPNTTTTNTVAVRVNASGGVWIGPNSADPGVGSLAIEGSFSRGAPVTKTNDFTLAATENWVICNKGSSLTVTLPAASTFSGREIHLKTLTAQTVVSATSNVCPNTTNTPGTAILPATAGAWCIMVSDGTNWIRMASSTIA